MTREPCPGCGRRDEVAPRLLLLDAARSSPSEWRRACACQGFPVDSLRPEFTPDGQFVEGLFCSACSIGFIPEHMLKPEPPRYQTTREGFHRVRPDGTLGPPLKRIADDPER